MKAGEFGRATAAIQLRKCTKLEDIENIINDLQKKSNDLLSAAEKEALRLAEQARLVQLEKNVKQITSKKLEFNQREALKRNRSFYGKQIKNSIDQENKNIHQQI